jgi:hypothetical protein
MRFRASASQRIAAGFQISGSRRCHGGPLQTPAKGGEFWWGSGYLVAPGVVLTASHVAPAADNGSAQVGTAGMTQVPAREGLLLGFLLT